MESREIQDLITHLPLPIAQLVARTLNAKFPSDRHHNAYFLGEAALKLATAARIGVWMTHAFERESPMCNVLEGLARPSTGYWLDVLRRLDVALARRVDASLLPLGPIAGLAAKEPVATPALAALVKAAKEEEIFPESMKADRGLIGTFGVFVTYRNKVLGHAGVRSTETYEKMWPLLLDAALEVVQSNAWLGNCRLAVVQTDYQGKRTWLGLQGTVSLPLASPELDAIPEDATLPNEPVLLCAGKVIPLAPLLTFQTEDERPFIHFLNETVVQEKAGADGRSEGHVRKAEYLNYLNGRVIKDDEHRAALRVFFGRLRGKDPISESELQKLESEGSLEDEPPEETVGTGTFIDDFELLEKIGHGGMGEVYKARQRSLRRIVAMKVLPRETSHDKTALERFRREIRALGKCEHPNVVKIFSSGEDAGRVYYTMEYVDGADLGKVNRALSSWKSSGVDLDGAHLNAAVTSGGGRTGSGTRTGDERSVPDPDLEDIPIAVPQPPPQLERTGDFYRRVAELFSHVADGLAHIHAQNVIHRDVKPENLMLTADANRLVIMDLGLAKISDSSVALTQDKSKTLGTLMYMAPEQLQMQHLTVDHRADVYGLGVCLYEVCAGRRFWREGTSEQVMKQILMDEPEPVGRVNPRIPKDLATIITKATQKNPEHRYATALDLAADLTAFHQLRPILALPPSLPHRATLFLRRHRASAAAIAAACFTLLIVIGVSPLFRSGKPAITKISTPAAQVRFEFCDRVEERWGVLSCAVPVTEEQQRHRWLTFRLKLTDGRVMQVDKINGHGLPFDGFTYGFGSAIAFYGVSAVARYEYSYHQNGQVASMTETTANGKFLQKWIYTDIQRRDRVDADGIPFREVTRFWGRSISTTGSHYTRELLTYDKQGCIASIRFINNYNLPQRNSSLHWGYDYERDPHCRVLRTFHLDKTGHRALDRRGVERIEFTYDERGFQLEQWHFSTNNRLTAGASFAGMITRYDEYGNPVEERYFDANRKPQLNFKDYPHRFFSRKNQYDSSGNIVEELYFGVNEKPTLTRFGFAGRKLQYDGRGRIVEGWFFGVDGKSITIREGIAGWRARYDDLGNVIETHNLGAEGKLIPDQKGVATTRFTVGADFIETRTYDIHDKLVLEKSGYAVSRLQYDKLGNPVENSFFDVDGKLTKNRSGCAIWRAKYNEHGDLIDYRCLGVDRSPVISKEGFSAWQAKYDQVGNRIERWFQDMDGKPILHRDGYAGVKSQYDENGNQISEWYYGVDERLVLIREGNAGWKARYDERGNQIEFWYFDADRKPVLHRNGYAGWKSSYDEGGLETDRHFFDANEKPTLTVDSISGRKNIYDSQGNLIRRQYLDIRGNIAPNKYGIAILDITVDDHQNPVEERYLDAQEKPVLHREKRMAGLRRKANAFGNIVREESFGLDGSIIDDRDGIAYIQWDYYPNLNRQAERVYNREGKLLKETLYNHFGEELPRPSAPEERAAPGKPN